MARIVGAYLLRVIIPIHAAYSKALSQYLVDCNNDVISDFCEPIHALCINLRDFAEGYWLACEYCYSGIGNTCLWFFTVALSVLSCAGIYLYCFGCLCGICDNNQTLYARCI